MHTSPLCGAVGSAFAAVNPPVSMMRADIPTPDELPTVFATVAPKPISLAESLQSQVATVADAARPVSAWRTRPTHGLVNIIVENWKPKSARDVPPSCTDRLGMFLSAQFAMLLNQSMYSRKRRWALVTTRGTVLIVSGITDRPINPSDFPSCVQGGLSFEVAEQLAIEANTPRFELSRVPREWTVAVRRADSVTDAEGGATC